MVNFVAFFKTTQDGNRIFLVGLTHQHFLEPALQRCVFFNVLAVLIQSRCTNAVKLAASQRRFEHVAGIHGALGFACANHSVDLIDEQNDLTFLLGQLAQNRLQSLLKVTPELGTGDQRAHIQ
jgi:hypothetical protein